MLVKSKYCFLKNPQNLTPTQQIRLKEVLQYDLKSVILKESFQLLSITMVSEKMVHARHAFSLKPIKRFVRSVRKHEPLPKLVSGQKGLFLRHCGALTAI